MGQTSQTVLSFGRRLASNPANVGLSGNSGSSGAADASAGAGGVGCV
ncbi:hypothetical protein ACCUM_0001 [Candidatus Accumulibacter phosphatis]|uniref:Uncharacterized protein n=1 Tax=Candidatus Accumulibacter phosphatis TaxID=327160 RepID=A0A5S4EGY0_9PROT|nr:hypothetical protein ACCUM_0001 [Candidatus Accumulibacter phosphatis]